ncbi:MAG: radical SAM protein [Heliobacteriaceae bacterium]|nr:radical SAM protein [Heliobacteriaceae bacterium]MDD4588400.1 radical SAM protein [Heliobacteriaceae bacterium]
MIERTENGPKLKSLQFPTSATYDLTLACNLKCRFCYQGNLREAGGPSLTTVKKVLDEMKRGGVKKVIFVGGEPFLHPAWVETLAYSHGLGITSSFVSNGTLITEQIVKRISGFVREGLISIHGDEETHDDITAVKGSYQKAVAGLRILSENGFKTGVYYTLTESNHSKLYATVRNLIEVQKVDFTWLALNRDLPIGKGSAYYRNPLNPQSYQTVLEQIEKIWQVYDRPAFLEVSLPFCLVAKKYHRYILTCRTGISHTAIDPDGNMKLCPVANEHRVGNILDQGLHYLWRNSPLLQEYRSLTWLPDKCRDCGYLGNCLGGCWVASKAYCFDRYN